MKPPRDNNGPPRPSDPTLKGRGVFRGPFRKPSSHIYGGDGFSEPKWLERDRQLNDKIELLHRILRNSRYETANHPARLYLIETIETLRVQRERNLARK